MAKTKTAPRATRRHRPVSQRSLLNAAIASYGKANGASRERIRAVQFSGDKLLAEGIPVEALKQSIAAQFEGSDAVYIGQAVDEAGYKPTKGWHPVSNPDGSDVDGEDMGDDTARTLLMAALGGVDLGSDEDDEEDGDEEF